MATEGFDGMAALIADLQRLPAEFRQEAGRIVDATADQMADAVRRAYPEESRSATGTGKLRDGVKVDKGDTAGGELRARVRNTARHAHLYERGTVQRFTGRGANRGTMPARPTFIPEAVRARARMVGQLIGIVRRARVRGMDGTLEVRET
jgi:hypothetical protein